MSSRLAEVVRQVCPPILLPGLKRLARRVYPRAVEWEAVGSGWPASVAGQPIRGWNVEAVLRAYVDGWPAFQARLQAPHVFGLGPHDGPRAANDVEYHNTLMSYAHALARASHLRPALSLLDWGGGLGHYYWISRALAPDLAIDYHCKDLPLLADYGRRHFPELHFYDDDACLQREYDLVLASGALHYSLDWQALLANLAHATAGWLFVTRLPVVFRAPSYVFVQRAYKYGYGTEFLGWCLNRHEFLQQAAGLGLELVREFMLGEAPDIVGAPEPCRYRGFLYRRP